MHFFLKTIFKTYPLATAELPPGIQLQLIGNHYSKVGYSVTFEAPLQAVGSMLGFPSGGKHRCQIVSICELFGPYTLNLPPAADSASRQQDPWSLGHLFCYRCLSLFHSSKLSCLKPRWIFTAVPTNHKGVTLRVQPCLLCSSLHMNSLTLPHTIQRGFYTRPLAKFPWAQRSHSGGLCSLCDPRCPPCCRREIWAEGMRSWQMRCFLCTVNRQEGK